MRRKGRKAEARIGMIAGLFLILFSPGAQAWAESVITPPEAYSDPRFQSLGRKYGSNLSRLQQELLRKFSGKKFRFLTTRESAVGGIGFWESPAEYGSGRRYLCVMARFTLPSSDIFTDNNPRRRWMNAFDAFGKETIYTLARELKTMNEPEIAGAGLIFIYGREDINDPAFEQTAEAFALFIPKDAAVTFASLAMTLQSLLSASTLLPLYTGAEDIQYLRTMVLSP